MKRNVKISVLMPAYNVDRFIGEAIQSVLSQTFPDFELLVINDGSADNTETVIRSFYDERIVLLNQGNKGIATALNNGLKKARSNYIVRFDADDICYSRRLETQYRFMLENPGCVLAGSAVDYIDENGAFVFTHNPVAAVDNEIKRFVKQSCPFIHSSVIYQKEAVLKHGGYNQHAHSFEDHLLWRSVVEEGNVANLQESLVKVRLNPGSITIDEQWRPKAFHRIKKKVIEENQITEEQGAALLQIIGSQNNAVLKEGAYYSLLAKKFLWNNHQPQKARACLRNVLHKNPFHLESYCFYALSFLPPFLLQKGYGFFRRKHRSPSSVSTSKKVIHLFVDAHCFDGEYQGSKTFVKEIYTLLVQRKDTQFYVAAHNCEAVKAALPQVPNIVFLTYRSRSSFFRLMFEIPRFIKKHQIDIAHFQYITPLIKNCRQIVTIHDVLCFDHPEEFPLLYRLLRRFFFKRSAATADILTTVSPYSKKAIQQHLETGLKQIEVLPNGVHPRYFKTYDKKQAKDFIQQHYGFNRFLLFVSRIEPRKNHLLLLQSFVELKLYEKSYHLVFIGHTSIAVPAFQTALDSLRPEVREFICLLQQVSENHLLQFYRAADLFVYPSKAEGFGIPPLEAGAACVPVVCSNTSAMKAFHFFAPYHIDPWSEQPLKNALTSALAEAQGETRLAEISNLIQRRYSWQAAADKLYQLITAKESEPAIIAKEETIWDETQEPGEILYAENHHTANAFSNGHNHIA